MRSIVNLFMGFRTHLFCIYNGKKGAFNVYNTMLNAVTKRRRNEDLMSEILLTPSAAARALAELGLPKSEGWLRYAAVNGTIPCVVTTTGRRLFRKGDIEKFVAKKSEKGN
jgi:hypothetical protein